MLAYLCRFHEMLRDFRDFSPRPTRKLSLLISYVDRAAASRTRIMVADDAAVGRVNRQTPGDDVLRALVIPATGEFAVRYETPWSSGGRRSEM